MNGLEFLPFFLVSVRMASCGGVKRTCSFPRLQLGISLPFIISETTRTPRVRNPARPSPRHMAKVHGVLSFFFFFLWSGVLGPQPRPDGSFVCWRSRPVVVEGFSATGHETERNQRRKKDI